MNKRVLKLAGFGIGVLSITVLLSVAVLAEEKQGLGMYEAKTVAPVAAEKCTSTKPSDKCKMQVNRLDEALKAIEAARLAVEANDKDKALASLNKARQLVATSRQAMAKVKMAKEEQGIVNVRCPIMGSKLDPAKVSTKLTKLYKGKKIGFCCPRCPIKWGKLSDEDKEQKLLQSFATK